MICTDARSLLSPYLDGALNGSERQKVAAHLESCAGCAREMAALNRTQELVGQLGRRQAPPDLALRLRVALSQEMSMTWERRLQRAVDRIEDAVNAFMLPATGGLVTALLMFGLLIGGFMTLPRVAAAGNDVPTTLYMPPKLASAPFSDMMTVKSDTPVVIEALVDANGRLQDYRIIAGQDTQEIRKQLDRSLIFTVFEPAISFGQRAPGKVVLTFANIDVRG